MGRRAPHLWRSGPGGRAVSWRVWVLIWVLPATMGLGALWLSFEVLWKDAVSVPAAGVVVRVYDWPGETLFDRGRRLYSPVFRYTEPGGAVREASVGLAHPSFDFALGSQHQIRIFPGRDRDALLPGRHTWMPAIIVGALALCLTLPSALVTWRVWRWLRAGGTACKTPATAPKDRKPPQERRP